MSNTIPSHSTQILTISRYELLMYLRGKKIFVMCGMVVAVAALYIAASEFFESMERPFLFELSAPISFVFYLGVILAAFFGGTSIQSEFHNKTAHLFFTNPVSRTSIWLGKFIAAEIISFAIILLYYTIITSYAAASSYDVPVEVIGSVLFSFVSITMIMSITFLISSLLKGSTGIVMLVFALFIIVFPAVDGASVLFSDFKPWFTPSFSSGIIQQSLTVPYPTEDNTMNNPFFGNRYIPLINQSLLVMISYSIISGVLSIFILRRREAT